MWTPTRWRRVYPATLPNGVVTALIADVEMHLDRSDPDGPTPWWWQKANGEVGNE